MLSKKEQGRLYYLKHREERIAYSKKSWEEKAKAYKEPDLEGEEWKPLTNYETHYQTSNMGRIKSVWHMKVRIINGAADKDGYRKITLTDDAGRQRTFRKCKIIFIGDSAQLSPVNEDDQKPQMYVEDEVDDAIS